MGAVSRNSPSESVRTRNSFHHGNFLDGYDHIATPSVCEESSSYALPKLIARTSARQLQCFRYSLQIANCQSPRIQWQLYATPTLDRGRQARKFILNFGIGIFRSSHSDVTYLDAAVGHLLTSPLAVGPSGQ